MASQNFSLGYTTDQIVNIPSNSINVEISVYAGRGGSGGNFGGAGTGGAGRWGRFSFKDDWTARSLNLKIGALGGNGGNGGGNGTTGGGGSGPGGSGIAAGGNGGTGAYTYTISYTCAQGTGYHRDQGPSCGCPPGQYCGGKQGNGDPCCGGALGTPGECFCCFYDTTCYTTGNGTAGGGGGGGGATGVANLVVAGGGGGGRGGTTATNGSAGGSWEAVTTSSFITSNGSNGSNTGSAGGTGGGGGGAGSAAAAQAGGKSRYNSNILTLEDSGTWTQDPKILITYTTKTPAINSFSVTITPQSQGVPSYTGTLSWGVSDFQYLTITGPGVNINTTNSTGSQSLSFGQSVAGVSSPLSYSYTLTVYAGDLTPLTSTKSVDVYNDNTPSNTWTTTFNNLEPQDPQHVEKIGKLAGIDMTTAVSCPDNTVFFSNSLNGTYSNPKYFVNGNDVYIKMATLPFNTDVTGETGQFGKVNTKTVAVTVGTQTFNVSYITKKPVIRETFDYDGNPGVYPYVDIDLIDNVPTEFVTTQTITMDDIDIAMPIQSDNPNVQIKINNQNWKNVGEIT